jgi:hypothetical protein
MKKQIGCFLLSTLTMLLVNTAQGQNEINCNSLRGKLECVNEPYSSLNLYDGGVGSLVLNYNDSYGRPQATWSGKQLDIKWTCDNDFVHFSFEHQGQSYSGSFSKVSKKDPDFGVQLNYLEYRQGSGYWKFLVKSR